MSSPRYPERTPDPERIDPRWAASTLGALAAVLLILWWVLAQVADDCDFELVPLLSGCLSPPASVAETSAWLSRAITETHAALDDTAKGQPEGVVVRTADRSLIAKIRFEDYARTLKATRRGGS